MPDQMPQRMPNKMASRMPDIAPGKRLHKIYVREHARCAKHLKPPIHPEPSSHSPAVWCARVRGSFLQSSTKASQ